LHDYASLSQYMAHAHNMYLIYRVISTAEYVMIL